MEYLTISSKAETRFQNVVAAIKQMLTRAVEVELRHLIFLSVKLQSALCWDLNSPANVLDSSPARNVRDAELVVAASIEDDGVVEVDGGLVRTIGAGSKGFIKGGPFGWATLAIIPPCWCRDIREFLTAVYAVLGCKSSGSGKRHNLGNHGGLHF